MKTKNLGKIILKRLQKTFPKIKEVVDATEPILICVSKKDSKEGKRKDPFKCALAKACVREQKCDGAYIGLNKSFIINGTKATRYTTGTSVGREITSFDRHHDFAEGKNYRLSPIAPSSRITFKRSKKVREIPQKMNKQYSHFHRTANIRFLKKSS